MKKEYEPLEMEIIEFDSQDVIDTSGPTETTEPGTGETGYR